MPTDTVTPALSMRKPKMEHVFVLTDTRETPPAELASIVVVLQANI